MTRQEAEIARNKSDAIRKLYKKGDISKQKAIKRYEELGLEIPNYLKEEDSDLYGQITQFVEEELQQESFMDAIVNRKTHKIGKEAISQLQDYASDPIGNINTINSIYDELTQIEKENSPAANSLYDALDLARELISKQYSNRSSDTASTKSYDGYDIDSPEAVRARGDKRRRLAQYRKDQEDERRKRKQRAKDNVRRGFDAGLVDYADTLEEMVKEELEAVLDEKRKKKQQKGKKRAAKKAKRKKKSGKKDACYHKVKSRYKVWPSAYASGALVKCRKVGAKNWGNSKKEHMRSIIEDELTKILQEAPSFSYRDYYNNPGVGHSGMFNEPEPDEYKKIKAKISEIIDDMKEELSFLSGAESALEEMKRKMLDPEQFDFNLAMGTDTYGRDSKPRAVYEERPKFGQFYIEFRDAVTQELREKLKSGEITKNQLFEIVYFADYRMKKGQYNYPSIARLKWIYKNLIQRDKYNRDENRISIDTLPDASAISNERYLEENQQNSLEDLVYYTLFEVLQEKKDVTDLKSKIVDALRKEGGAAGMDALEKHTKAPKEDIKKVIDSSDNIKIHEDGDVILMNSLDEKKKRKKKRKLTAKPSSETSLRDWFGRKGAKGKKGGWVDCNTCRKDKKTGRKKCSPCGRSGGEKRAKYPSCRPTPGACGKRGKWGKKSKKGKKG